MLIWRKAAAAGGTDPQPVSTWGEGGEKKNKCNNSKQLGEKKKQHGGGELIAQCLGRRWWTRHEAGSGISQANFEELLSDL